MGAGVTIGFIGGDDESGMMSFTAEENAALYGIGLGIIGASLGTLVGIRDNEIISINFDIMRFRSKKHLLKKYENVSAP